MNFQPRASTTDISGPGEAGKGTVSMRLGYPSISGFHISEHYYPVLFLDRRPDATQ